MGEIEPEILEEVEDCIRQIRAFHEAQGRRIFKRIARSRKGREGIKDLETLGLPVPEDFRALYYNYNGTKPSSMLSMWETNVFLQFDWYEIDLVVKLNRVARIRDVNPVHNRLEVFHSSGMLSMDLRPGSLDASPTPLLMRAGVLARNSFIAFDSTLAMLRSVCAAQDAGILSYNKGFVPALESGEQPIQPNQILYDVQELWDVIQPFNPRADYWLKAIEGSIDWNETSVERPPEPWKVQVGAEAARIMFGDPKPKTAPPALKSQAESGPQAADEAAPDAIEDVQVGAAPSGIAWVLSEGGPYLLVPEENLADWRGVEDWSGTLDDPADQSDYARACRVECRVGSIRCGNGSALVLSQDNGPVAWFGDDGGRGGMLIQDRQASDEATIRALVKSGEARMVLDSNAVEDLELETGPSGGLRLIDAADSGADLQAASIRIRLQPGCYRVRAGDIETDNVSLIIREVTYHGPVQSRWQDSTPASAA